MAQIVPARDNIPGARLIPIGGNRKKYNDVHAKGRCIYFCYLYRVWHLKFTPSSKRKTLVVSFARPHRHIDKESRDPGLF